MEYDSDFIAAGVGILRYHHHLPIPSANNLRCTLIISWDVEKLPVVSNMAEFYYLDSSYNLMTHASLLFYEMSRSKANLLLSIGINYSQVFN